MGKLQPLLAIVATLASLTLAEPSVPIATNPILTTVTLPTVSISLVTVYSVVPATDASPNVPTTTFISGRPATLTPTGVIAGSSTETIISTVSLTTSEVVVQTIGFSTILGPNPVTPVSNNFRTVPTALLLQHVSRSAKRFWKYRREISLACSRRSWNYRPCRSPTL
jgi:hypothetical protein